MLCIAALWVFSVAGFFGSLHWLVDLLDHMRMHFLVAGVLATAIIVCARNRRWFIIASMCCALNAVVVEPWRLFDFQSDSAAHDNVRLLTWNTLWANPDHTGVSENIDQIDADIVVLIEFTEALSAQLGHLRTSHPYFREVPSERAFGIAVYSRLPATFRIYSLASGNVPCVEATIDPQRGEPFQLWGVHLFPPMGEMWAYRERQFGELTALISATPCEHTIVCGDFNDTPWSRTCRQFRSNTKLVDSRNGKGYSASWPSTLNAAGIPIDHVFTTPSVTISNRQTDFLHPQSDHAAVIVDFAVATQAGL